MGRPWQLWLVLRVASASWWNFWSTAPPDLEFDLAASPKLVGDNAIFPDEYRKQMRWGTYRPGVYFGAKGRHQGSLLMGLAWSSVDGKSMRHECQSGELQSFNWLEHDGENYALQNIEDQKLGLQLRTTFVKDGFSAWRARVEAMPLASLEPAQKERPVSLFIYLGVEAAEPHGLQPGEVPAAWQRAGGDWIGTLQLRGSDPAMGPFLAHVHLRCNASDEKPPARWRRVAARVAHEAAPVGAESDLTGVWDAKRHLERFLRKAQTTSSQDQAAKKSKQVVLPDKDLDESPNFWAVQILGRPSNGFSIEVHVTFEEADGDSDAERSLKIDELAHKYSDAFKKRLVETFALENLEKRGDVDVSQQQAAVGAAVSGLLGGLGDFRGRLLAKSTGAEDAELERLPAAVLFSGVPSRSFFPRGFLWDEGFHGLILARWQPRLFLDVLSHWLELQQPSGWIPREVPLGAEQEVRVPRQFLPQDPTVANPPSFLLPLAWLVSIAAQSGANHGATAAAAALAARAGMSSAGDFKQLVLLFGSQALPRLAAWFAFLDKSQRSANAAGCYKWAGRTAAHCLASGLDDYPRGLLVNEDECHLDLHSWMMVFARMLASLCQQLGSAGALAKDQASALCEAPGWSARAEKLNATLHEVFVDGSRKADAPLADFIGKQPAKKNKVMVVPPWRSDGRCGREFPVEGAPGECDPYGGAPCCSPSGWCGGSPDFCQCPGCRRFQRLEDRQQGAQKTIDAHSPHLGYVSLFPLLLGLLPCDHPRALPLLRALQPPGAAGKKGGELWSPHGVVSLSTKDPLFRQGEDYWRGKIWANLNYLTISALHQCAAHGGGPSKELAEKAHASLRDGFVSTVLHALQRQRFFFENFDPASGEGKGVGPFTGWTTLVALVIADLPLAPEAPSQLPSEASSKADL